MYFANMPIIKYDMGTVSKLCKNILVCAKFNDFFRGPEDEQLFIEYKVKDGETPEEIAHRVYGTPNLNWILLLFNNIKNPYFEWPLSQSQMESQLYQVYPGSAIFVDLDPVFISTSGTALTIPLSNFVVGEVVGHELGYWTGIVSKWDSTLRKVEIIDIEGSFDSNTSSTYTGKIVTFNREGVEFETTMNRVVFDNTYALHHFEDSDGNVLDPYEDFVGRTLSRTSLTDSALSENFMLKSYIEESSDTNVIVNRVYEDNLNDDKRNIKILKIEYVQRAIDAYLNIFNG